MLQSIVLLRIGTDPKKRSWQKTSVQTEMGTSMWFLIKGSFWFSLVLVMLPFLDAESQNRLANAPPVKIDEAVSAAAGALQYVTSMCTERPDVCDKGSKALVALGTRAKDGALVAYKMIDKKLAENGQPSDENAEALTTQTTKVAARKSDDVQKLIDAEAASQDGLVTGTTKHPIPVPKMRPIH